MADGRGDDRQERQYRLFRSLLDMGSAQREEALRELEENNDPDLADVRTLLQHREQADAEQFLAGLQEGGGPDRIGRYRVVAPLGRGGQADLFRAVDPELRRDVVI